MSYAERYDPDLDFDRWFTVGTGRAVVEAVEAGQTLLELGCATGLMTAHFAAAGALVTAVDHAESYLERARARGLPGVELVASDIVELALGRTFDHVVLANVAHEVDDPGRLLRTAAAHTGPGGLVHVTLPNPHSIHRLLGRAMGLIESLDELSERARTLDTIALLDVPELVDLAGAAGLAEHRRGGVMVKPLPNALMATLPDDVLEGFLAAAPDLPGHCAMNYVVFRNGAADG